MAEIKHPNSGEVVVGRLLEEFEAYEEGDLYSGDGESWVSRPEMCYFCEKVGLCPRGFLFVRPEK